MKPPKKKKIRVYLRPETEFRGKRHKWDGKGGKVNHCTVCGRIRENFHIPKYYRYGNDASAHSNKAGNCIDSQK